MQLLQSDELENNTGEWIYLSLIERFSQLSVLSLESFDVLFFLKKIWLKHDCTRKKTYPQYEKTVANRYIKGRVDNRWGLTELDTPPSLMTVSTAVLPPAAALTPAPPSSPSRSLRFSGGAPEDEGPLGSAGRFCPDIVGLLKQIQE